MEVANVLISMADEDSNDSVRNGNDSDSNRMNSDGNDQKRYLPDHKKPDAALTFPEKLMSMMRHAEQQGEGFCVSWLNDGKSFIIRDADVFTKKVVPKFFKATKFSSFTRKLYRWGFRQVNRGIGQDDPIIFGSEHFQRDAPELMSKMKSITAAATRKAEETSGGSVGMCLVGSKRPSEVAQIELQQQLLLRQLLSKKANVGSQPQSDMNMSSCLFGSNRPQTTVGNFQSCVNSGNMNNTMSLSQMLHSGNQSSGNYSFTSGGLCAPQFQPFSKSCNNLFMELEQQQQPQMMQQQQNDSLLGNLMCPDRSNGQMMLQDRMGGQFVTPDRMGQLLSQDRMGQLLSQDRMGQLVSQDRMGQLVSQDRMGQLVSQERMGQLVSQDRMGQLVSQDRMGQLVSQDRMGQFLSQDKMNQFTPQDFIASQCSGSHDKLGGQFMGQESRNANNQLFMQDKIGDHHQFLPYVGQGDSSLLGQFNQVCHGTNTNFLVPSAGKLQDFPNSATTADIVSAAIQALNYNT